MKDDLAVRFGRVLKRIRESRRLTQDELALRAKLHRTYISDVERGSRNLSLASMQKLVTGLDTSLTRVFELAEKPDHEAGGESVR